MNDQINSKSAGYLVISVIVFLLGIEYLGVVAPQLLIPNFLLDLLAPFSFEYGINFRMTYVLTSVIVATMTGETSTMGEMAQTPQRKAFFILLLAGSTFVLYTVHLYPYLLYALLYPLAIVGCGLSAFIIGSMLRKPDKGHDTKFGFEKTLRKISNTDSFHLYSAKDGWLNIENIFRHLFLLGGPGAGKSFSIIEPLIQQAIQKGWAMLIFDFKMKQNFDPNPKNWALSRFAYMQMLRFSTPAKKENGKWVGPQSCENDRRKMFLINFTDVRFSHRVNPIHPEYLQEVGFANEYAITLMTNLQPDWIQKRDFFADSAIAYLKAIIWFLRCEFPESCTLPHVIAICMMPYNKVMAMLSLNDECKEIMSALKVADEKNAEGQLAGVDATLKTPIDKLNTPAVSWILSGNDFSLMLNDPENPSILCLGSDPELQETYSPIAALIATVCGKVMNKPGMLKSMYVLDEAPQLKLPKLSDLAATCRSNNLAILAAGQDFAQFKSVLGDNQAAALSGTLNNHFYGQVKSLETAKMVSESIGQREKNVINYSFADSKGGEGGKSKTDSHNLQKESLVQPHEMISLQTGRFVGSLAHVSYKDDKPEYSPFFNFRPDIERPIIEHEFPHLLLDINERPLSAEKVRELVLKNHKQIKGESFKLVDSCARAACMNGVADESKVFPTHFYWGPGENKGRRIVSTSGEVMPGVKGISIDPETMIIKGTPTFEPTNEGMDGGGLFRL